MALSVRDAAKMWNRYSWFFAISRPPTVIRSRHLWARRWMDEIETKFRRPLRTGSRPGLLRAQPFPCGPPPRRRRCRLPAGGPCLRCLTIARYSRRADAAATSCRPIRRPAIRRSGWPTTTLVPALRRWLRSRPWPKGCTAHRQPSALPTPISCTRARFRKDVVPIPVPGDARRSTQTVDGTSARRTPGRRVGLPTSRG